MKLSSFITTILVLMVLALSCKKEEKTNNKQTKKTITEKIAEKHNEEVSQRYKKLSHLNLKTEEEWDSVNGFLEHSIPALGFKKHEKKYKTFGWHMYTSGRAYRSYNFDLLWGIAYFSYELNYKTGDYKSIHQWKTTALIDSAKAHNCKVFLAVNNFGTVRNSIFLKNTKAQEKLADNLITLLEERNAAGVNLDFENVLSKDATRFNDFIVRLSKRLKEKNPDFMVSVALYAVNYHNVFDISKIKDHVDFYTMMGYDYYGKFSKHAGPSSPLKSGKIWAPSNLESSIDHYIQQGVRKDQLIVGLPYYGNVWETESERFPSTSKKFITQYSFSTIHKKIRNTKHLLKFDTISATRYYPHEVDGKYRQMWFEDAMSLGYKYDWIKKEKLAGVGIWALGYDHGTKELWNVLAEKFGTKEEK